jgi:hypothetical protein
MALTLGTDARNASVNGRTALVNGGSLKIKAGSTVLATITLPATAFNAAASGSATARGADGTNPVSSGNPLTDASADAAGTATVYDACDSGGNVEWSGAVGAELTLDNAVIAAGQEVKVTGWTHSQPA